MKQGRWIAAPALLALAVTLAGAESWRIQFPADAKPSQFSIHDLKFSSPTQGVAVGQLGQGRKAKPVALVTGDGGVSWEYIDTKEAGLSLFFLNPKLGWMVTERGLWKTVESGRIWTRIAGDEVLPGALSVHFLDENRGWVVARRKTVYATTDGGVSWSRVGAAEEVDCSPSNTSYNWITFADGRSGMIVGASLPPSPGNAKGRRELPHLSIFLDTRDGGNTWKASTTSMFGRVAKVLFTADGTGLGLIEFQNQFDFPSEVFGIDWKTGKSSRVYRSADRAITDIAFDVTGTAFLAGVEPRGGGQVKVLKSRDLSIWEEMEVDGRARGRRVTLAIVDQEHAWMATDTGLILRLETEPKQKSGSLFYPQ